MNVLILGLNAFHTDSPACALKDGRLGAAVAEERLGPRCKHVAGFSARAIAEVLRIIGASIQDVDYVAVGNDNGAMQLAATVGRGCVTVFSARDWPGIWEPYGKGHKVLRFDVPCSGCRLSVCNQQLQCLRGIQAEQVYEACLAVLGNGDNQ